MHYYVVGRIGATRRIPGGSVLQRFAAALATRAARQGNWGTTPSSKPPLGPGAAPAAHQSTNKGLPAPELWIFLRSEPFARRCLSSLDTRGMLRVAASLRLVLQDKRSAASGAFCGCRFRGGAFA